ncbi:MAG: glycoside hydrolase family 2 TIM barrel-domain containing protein, partial [Clostridia bacterium]
SLVTDINILPDRAYYIPSGAKYTELTQWNFTYFPEETDEIFSCFGKETVVPSCWQIERKQDIQYTNVRFPFPYCPPDILKANPCGVYVTNLNVKEILSDKQFYINFDGVDSCYYLYVNGSFVSYCSISHRHSESNITNYLRVGDNELRVIVFKWNCSSYLEDQDKIRLSGIFNKVYILERNTDHICNYRIDTSLTSQNEAIVSITSDKNCNYALSVDEKNIVKESGITATFVIKSPNLWSAEIPNLYKLNIEYNEETIYENVGIRKIEIKNKQVLLNGKPIKLYGVNRHSMTINGYVETEDDLVNDILLLKKLNVNAVRTSHYPPSPRFPALCDKYGLYLMEEADCECHGVVTQNGSDGTEDYSLYCDIAKNPIFCEQIVKRATSMVVRDYNRPSVIFWSLGNESGWGDNFVQSGKAVKRLDTSRLLHY